jgi:hypothetical protein
MKVSRNIMPFILTALTMCSGFSILAIAVKFICGVVK